jgi:uncharacterized membrane protein
MAGFFAVLVTILSSTSINIGKALQKKGTKSLPKLTFKKDILKTYFENDTWKLGLVLDVLGGVLMILALAIAPVSVVQPVAAGGVAILAGFSHVFLDEKLKEKEWVGVWCAVVGTVGIGWTTGVNTAATAVSEKNGNVEINVSTWRYVLGVFVVLGSTYLCMPSTASGTGSGGMLAPAGTGKVGGSNAASSSSSSTMPDVTPGTTPQKGSGHGNKNDHFLKSPPTKESMNASMMTPPKKDKNDKKDKSENASSVSAEFKQQRFRDMLAGARAGALFSLSASSVKLGFQLSRRLAFIWALIGLAASVSLTALGLFSQTKGLKEGNAVVVVCSGNVAQMVTAIPFGILCLGESLPGIGFLFGARGLGVGFFHNVFTFLVWAFSWWLILFGVVIVSGLSTHDVVATIAATGDIRKSVVLPTTMGEAKAMLLSKKEKNKDASRKE